MPQLHAAHEVVFRDEPEIRRGGPEFRSPRTLSLLTSLPRERDIEREPRAPDEKLAKRAQRIFCRLQNDSFPLWRSGKRSAGLPVQLK
jgi:hypothetical protein